MCFTTEEVLIGFSSNEKLIQPTVIGQSRPASLGKGGLGDR